MQVEVGCNVLWSGWLEETVSAGTSARVRLPGCEGKTLRVFAGVTTVRVSGFHVTRVDVR